MSLVTDCDGNLLSLKATPNRIKTLIKVKGYCLLVKPVISAGKTLSGKYDKISACQHIFFQLYVHLLPPALRFLACGVTLAFRERSLGPELNADFVVAFACPQPGNAPAASGCIVSRDSKTHWFWSSSLQVYRVYLTRRGMSTLRKAI